MAMMEMRGVIYVVMMKYVDLGFRRPDTLLFKILEKVLMVMGEVNICLRPATITPITRVTMLGYCVYMFLLVVFTEVFMVTK